MTEKQVRTLTKLDMLKMLQQQEVEINRLQTEKTEAIRQLDERRIQIGNAGSIAEASLMVSGIMKAAQDAADIFLENVCVLDAQKAEMLEELEEKAAERANAIYNEAERRRIEAEREARQIIAEVEHEARQIITDMQIYVDWCDSFAKQMRESFSDISKRLGTVSSIQYDDAEADSGLPYAICENPSMPYPAAG